MAPSRVPAPPGRGAEDAGGTEAADPCLGDHPLGPQIDLAQHREQVEERGPGGLGHKGGGSASADERGCGLANDGVPREENGY